ncbi:MAG: hypothetical protein A2271_03070 [Candidatus Moranbacteria bacterium RIFOXYA12_FULL_35_19]|nr:MAG: hypothetical protein UR78_C0010G0051 [Candidatus Moranbacteria bacterium GW2011_GWF2_35_39]OGI31228.1 MAG: hypothetical protein A2343_02805 [Candidatus Moranbacteria bacterium RIFOXYB12_FULL_35_8]OGI32297.1 MAG: hypothetical protein A2489_03075 [Candidatus Moranbacteria bacterium RIFOXYC12_FULL_36_13]OGI36557.1 MAG: hypothetical protein A2271_03070 [Candidatus Moranbacteria bacterium RIFOXYA12_FULL_35_19]
MMKKNVLWISSIVIMLLLFVAYIQNGDICYSRSWCNNLWDTINIVSEIILIFIPVFIFSLITYKMREEVFQSWWRFARWFVPVIMLVTFLIYSQHQGGGMGISGAISSGFNDLIVGIFYVIFIITSAIKIALAYRRKK